MADDMREIDKEDSYDEHIRALVADTPNPWYPDEEDEEDNA